MRKGNEEEERPSDDDLHDDLAYRRSLPCTCTAAATAELHPCTSAVADQSLIHASCSDVFGIELLGQTADTRKWNKYTSDAGMRSASWRAIKGVDHRPAVAATAEACWNENSMTVYSGHVFYRVSCAT